MFILVRVFESQQFQKIELKSSKTDFCNGQSSWKPRGNLMQLLFPNDNGTSRKGAPHSACSI